MLNTYKTFDLFTRALIGANDVDPDYLVLQEIRKRYNFHPIWYAFMFCSFDDQVSAFRLTKEMPTPEAWNAKLFLKLREEVKGFGGRRRGSGTVAVNQVRTFDKLKLFLEENKFDFSTNLNYRKQIQKKIPYYGETQAFKVGETSFWLSGKKSIELNDLGLEQKNLNAKYAVVGGLRELFGKENTYDKNIIPVWEDFSYLLGEYYGVEKLRIETCLCEFSKLLRGRYYVGHKISYFYQLKPYIGNNNYYSIMENHFDEYLYKDEATCYEKKRSYIQKGKIENLKFAKKTPSVDVEGLVEAVKQYHKIN